MEHAGGVLDERCPRVGAGERWRGLAELEEGLRKMLQRKCRDANDVDDVIQETYLRAARYRRGIDDPRRLRAWTFRIALNVLADLRRRARRHVALPSREDCEDGVVPEALVYEEVDRDVRLGRWMVAEEDAYLVLGRAIEGLREDDRVLLAHYYAEGASVQECARVCAVPAKLVKVRLYRARQRLLRAMDSLLSLSRDVIYLEPAS